MRWRLLVSALLCLVMLFGTSLSVQAQVYQITEQELTRLETNSTLLLDKIAKLEQTLNKSQKDLKLTQDELVVFQKELEEYRKALREVQLSLMKLGKTSLKVETNLALSAKSLKMIGEYIEQYDKEVKAEIKKLKQERNIARTGFWIALYYALTK